MSENLSADDLRETLETLEEIYSAASSLEPDLTDKRTISDIMLAVEKTLPLLRARLSGKLLSVAEALAMLYEKFLMEMVPDGGPGIEKTKDGVRLIEAVLREEKEPSEAEDEAGGILSILKEKYQIEPPAPAEGKAPAPLEEKKPKEKIEAQTQPPEETKGEKKEDEDEDFFAEMAKAPAPAAPAEEEEKNPLAEKLSDIASDVTLLDSDMLDKKVVSDIMIGFENLSESLASENHPTQLVRLASAMGGIYEKSLMEGLADGQRGLDLTSDSIKIISSYFDKLEPPEDLFEAAEKVISAISGELEIETPGTSPAEKAEEAETVEQEPQQAEVVEEQEEAPPPAGEPFAMEQDGAYTIHISTDDDMLLYSEFVSETAETAHRIETDLLDLEVNPSDIDLVNNIFREFHSLKGAAGFLGLNTINILCHEAESLLDKIRKHELVCGHDMIEVLLKSADVIKLVNEGVHDSIEKAKKDMPNAEIELPVYRIDELVDYINALMKGSAEAAGYTSEEEAEEEAKLGDILKSKHVISEDQLEKALQKQERKPLGQILVDMGAVDNKTVGEALVAQEEKRRKMRVSALKVDTEKLDGLMDLVGELVISQSLVAQDSALSDEMNRGLMRNITNLGKITKNIQDHVMSLRMVPLRQTFQKMSRLVRDLSKKMNKPVVFEVSGEDTEIDKTIIEELNDPLVHLLRNSMDHGIETPEERHALGKNITGVINLSAYHSGGSVHIEINDDGKGMDREKILRKAVEKGLVAQDAELSEHDIYNLIFMPGFSTHDVATDISGRGVGMDVVYSNIDRLGGRVDINSKPGEGANITVKLPLTMAIVDGMIVRIGSERFIIPTISIRESIRPKKEEVSTVKREGEMVNVRGNLLPLIKLREALQIDNAAAQHPWEGLVIIVESDGREYGFMVDDLLGQQQVVIKSLGKRFKGLPGVSGGTILGDGRIGLILDVSGAVGMA